ncbi:MAG: Crp/Fnr family transcriptional regulator [candidate division NC10 bacterium]|nr:Crp/Fnr family transcriptional regulator [candidate division NC10 bacterium]
MAPAAELWEGFSPEEREQVARFCPERRFSRGSTIFAPGDAPDALYIVTSGLVTLSHVSQDGQESILRVFGPGDVFGELFLTVRARPFLATALTACGVTVIPSKTFLHLLTSIPRIGFNFICVLSRHLAEMALDRGQASHTWAFQRLTLTLLKLAAAHGLAQPAGTTITLPLTHQILADMIGTSRETATRHLGELKRRGLVRQRGRTFLIQKAGLQGLVPGWPPTHA